MRVRVGAIAAALAVMCGSGLALVNAYHLDPATANQSGWTRLPPHPSYYVSEVVTVNFDLPVSASLFCGSPGAGGSYDVDIYAYPGGINALAFAHNMGGTQNHQWLNCSLTVAFPDSFIKGRQVEVRWTRSGSDSIQYYTRQGTEYLYGFMRKGGGFEYPTLDLCARVCGVMDTITADWWSVVPGCPWDAPELLGTWRARMETLAVKRADFSIYWQAIEATRGTLDFSADGHDTRAHQLHSELGCVLDARPQQCPSWASSRIEADSTMCHYCAPRNLFRPVSDDSDSTGNYWARFVRRTIQHYDALGDTIHIWTGWNEPNDTLNLGDPPTTGWWRRPNLDYAGLWDGARGLCSLYVQLCMVTESVIHHGGLTGHENDKILVGSTSRVRMDTGGWDTLIVPGDTWIWMCYDIASRLPGGIFWDGVAVHPYQLWYQPLAGDLEADARRVHEIMRGFEHNGEVWNEELGWHYSVGAEKQARNLAEAFVVTKGSEASPEGGYDGMMWYTLLGIHGQEDCQQILDPDLTPRPAFHAFRQATHQLTGKRLNGRVMAGDSATDSLVRMYEFENEDGKRTWVCWKNDTVGYTGTKLPAHVDTLISEKMDYGGPPEDYPEPVYAAADGWLSVNLLARPVFITEPDDRLISRPDLAIDSLWLEPPQPRAGRSLTVYAQVSNHGTRATPQHTSPMVLLSCNDRELARTRLPAGIAAGQSRFIRLTVARLPEGLVGPCLFRVSVNPRKEFVELNFDDNVSCTRSVVLPFQPD